MTMPGLSPASGATNAQDHREPVRFGTDVNVGSRMIDRCSGQSL